MAKRHRWIHTLERPLIRRQQNDEKFKPFYALHVRSVIAANDDWFNGENIVLFCVLPNVNPHSKKKPKKRYRCIFTLSKTMNYQGFIVDDQFYLQSRNKVTMQSNVYPSWKDCLAELLSLPFFQVGAEAEWTSHYDHYRFYFLSPYRDNNLTLSFNPKPKRNTWIPPVDYSEFNNDKNTLLNRDDLHDEHDAIQRFHAATDKEHLRIINDELSEKTQIQRMMISSDPINPDKDVTSL